MTETKAEVETEAKKQYLVDVKKQGVGLIEIDEESKVPVA